MLALKALRCCVGSGVRNKMILPLTAVHARKSSSSDTPSSLVGRDFLTLKQFTKPEIETLLWTAKDLKTRIKDEQQLYQPLVGKSLAMIFQKRSTRTRMSSETGMSLLGGNAVFCGPDDVHFGVNETIADSARVMSGFCDLILARVFGQEIVDTLAVEASVPVISGLSDLYHPLQTLADLMTLQEHYGYLSGLKLAWVGDGNNIIHSLMMGCTRLGIDMAIATPQGYECDPNVTNDALKFSSKFGSEIRFTSDPLEAVHKAHVVVTDTWVSMGQEEEKVRRMQDFAGYQITRKMLKHADSDWRFLHCLPRKQEEVDDDVFYDRERSLVWQEAENRKWTVMAVLLHALQDHVPRIPKPKYLRS